MKIILSLLILSFSINSCALESQLPGYRFSNFDKTEFQELAKAVKDDNAEKIKELINQDKLNIDFKDPKYQQTLLTLSIVNQKKNAFIELLNAGANPNELLGESKDSTPFMTAIEYQENCDLFYIQSLLKFKADINKELILEDQNRFNLYTFPLLAAILNSDNNGDECLDTIKFLVNNGANINYCFPKELGYCEGVIARCLTHTSLENLKYFVIEKQISLPKKVYATGQIDPKTMKIYSLSEALNSEDFQYEDFTDEQIGFIDKSKLRKLKNEILDYLKKTDQK